MKDPFSKTPSLPAQKIRILAQCPLFAGIDGKALEALALRALLREFRPGELLFEEGDPCIGICVLARGCVRIFKTSSTGRQILLAAESAPSSLAEIPLFDGGPYPASVAASSEVTALTLRKEDFQAVCHEYPDLAIRVLAKVGTRLRQLVGLVEQVTFGNVRQRLAQTLLEFHRQAGTSSFTLPETHEKLALRLGTVREVVSRNLSRFQAEGLLTLHRREVVILDPAALQQEADTEF
jgi:CRP/FNR family transcriptional regulator